MASTVGDSETSGLDTTFMYGVEETRQQCELTYLAGDLGCLSPAALSHDQRSLDINVETNSRGYIFVDSLQPPSRRFAKMAQYCGL